MNAGASIRVSSTGQVERGTSLSSQEEDVRAYCAAQGDTLTALITDSGVSGYDVDRASLESLEALVRSGAIQKVIFTQFDRLGRSAVVGLSYVDRWREAGVSIVFLNRPHADQRDPDQWMMTTIEAGMAEREGHRIKERTGRGRLALARQGRIPHKYRAYGYDTLEKWQTHLPGETGQSGELRVNPAEAAIVREMFRRYAEGASLRGVAAWLRGAGIPTKGGNQWTSAGVRGVLLNEVYVGRCWWGRTVRARLRHRKTSTGTAVVKVEPRPLEEWTLIPVPPILVNETGAADQALFASVQAKLAYNREHKPGRPSAYPLSGLLFCGNCRGKRGGRFGMGRNRTRLRCNSAGRLDAEWCGTTANAEAVLAAVQQRALWWTEPSRLGKAARRHLEQRQRHDAPLRARLAKTAAAIADVQAKRGRLADLVLEGFPAKDVQQRVRTLNATEARLEAERQELRDALVQTPDPEQVAEALERRAAEWRRLLASEEPALRRQVYAELFEVLVYGEARIEVRLREAVLSGGSSS